MIAPSQKKTPKDSRAVLQSSLSKLLTSQYFDCLCLPPLSLSTSPNSLFGLLLSFLSSTPNFPSLSSSYIFCLGSVSLNIKASHHGSQGSWDPKDLERLSLVLFFKCDCSIQISRVSLDQQSESLGVSIFQIFLSISSTSNLGVHTVNSYCRLMRTLFSS